MKALLERNSSVGIRTLHWTVRIAEPIGAGHELIKTLMTKTLDLMIEAEFEIKIGAKRVNKHLKESGHQSAPNCTDVVTASNN